MVSKKIIILRCNPLGVSLRRGLHVITPSNTTRRTRISPAGNATASRAGYRRILSVQPNHGWAHLSWAPSRKRVITKMPAHTFSKRPRVIPKMLLLGMAWDDRYLPLHDWRSLRSSKAAVTLDANKQISTTISEIPITRLNWMKQKQHLSVRQNKTNLLEAWAILVVPHAGNILRPKNIERAVTKSRALGVVDQSWYGLGRTWIWIRRGMPTKSR